MTWKAKMSRKRRDTSSQRSMGDFVSRAGSSNRVEIIDDEDEDEVEEINTVSIKMDKRYQVVSRSAFILRKLRGRKPKKK